MNAYVYQAALLCEECGRAQRQVMQIGFDPEDEEAYDSDEFPKGPYPEGGGEADCPQHCDHCGTFLENPLTSDGYRYVSDAIAEARAESRADSVALTEWRPFYNFCDDEEQAKSEEVLRRYGFWPKHLGG